MITLHTCMQSNVDIMCSAAGVVMPVLITQLVYIGDIHCTLSQDAISHMVFSMLKFGRPKNIQKSLM